MVDRRKPTYSYAESSLLTAIRDAVRLIVLAMIFWSANTLNNVDKDTNNLKWRMQRIEQRVQQLEAHYSNGTHSDEKFN